MFLVRTYIPGIYVSGLMPGLFLDIFNRIYTISSIYLVHFSRMFFLISMSGLLVVIFSGIYTVSGIDILAAENMPYGKRHISRTEPQ